MEYLPQVTIAQQLKSMIQTSQQSKQKLAHMNSVLDTQVIAAANPTTDTHVTTTFTQVCDDQEAAEAKPAKNRKFRLLIL